MIAVTLAWVLEKVNAKYRDGVLPQTFAKTIIKGVSTDTRSIKKGDLFIALVGPNFNGHDYIQAAIDKGAGAAIISDTSSPFEIPTLVVNDTRIALGQLGAAVKEKVAPKTVGITGSSGKTTVKEMVYSILSTRGKVLATKGNFNNDIGVPLTLLALTEAHDYAVIEMGANHQGEIEYTCDLVKPDVATIINAAPAHIEGFGSLFGVARAKSEIIKGLSSDAVAILNRDSQFFEFWQGTSNTKQILTFSYETDNGDFHANKVSISHEGCPEFELVTPIGKVAIKLRVPGVHNIGNAVLAAALAISVGANLANVQKGLFNMQSVAGRLAIKLVAQNVRVLDDTYNANVGSVKAAIDLLASFKGYRVFVFGDMGELGDQTNMYHTQIGEYAYDHNIDALISCGPLSKYASDVMQNKGSACLSNELAFEALIKLISPYIHQVSANESSNSISNTSNKNKSEKLVEQKQSVTILIKGSRSAQTEQIVNALKEFDFNVNTDKLSSNYASPNKEDPA